MNKKGQVYIIASIIIIIILIGLAGISNQTTFRQQPSKFFGFGNDLEREGYSLYDYGKYNNADIPPILNQFTEIFSKYVQTTGETTEFVTIYGNNAQAVYTVYGYGEGTTAELGASKTSAGLGNLQVTEKQTISNPGTTLAFTFKNEDYFVPLTQNEAFLFIFTKSEGLNKYISTNTAR